MSDNTFKTDGTIDSFENQFPQRDYEIEFEAAEFTSVCPMTGQPDFGSLSITYVPEARCIELRSFKFYLHGFRDRGIFYEDVVNTVLDDIVEAISPRSATVRGDFNRRGGISARITASFSAGTD